MSRFKRKFETQIIIAFRLQRQPRHSDENAHEWAEFNEEREDNEGHLEEQNY